MDDYLVKVWATPTDGPRDILVDLYKYNNHAEFAFKRFQESYLGEIIRASRHNGHRYIRLKDGNTYWFITHEEYPRWSAGRTYEFDGKMFHSGICLGEGDAE